MIISAVTRGGVTLALVLTIACRSEDRGGTPVDTARPQADSSRPPAAVSSSTKGTMRPAPLRANTRPTLVIGTATIVLDSTSLAQVQGALGAQSIVGDKTGINRLLKACYIAGPPDDRVTVRLSALGYVDDGNATMEQGLATIPINSAVIARGDVIGAGSSTPKRCAPLSVPPAEIHWANGLRLGMTRAEVERLLGASGTSEDGEWVYKHYDPDFREVAIDTATGQQREWRWSVTVGVQVRYDQDVAAQIEASYVKSIRGDAHLP